MEEPTEYNQVNLLADRINERMMAQIEAHERYSQAFIEILKTLDRLSEKIGAIGSTDQESLRDLLQEVTRIASELHSQHDSAREMKADLTDKLDECVVITREFIVEIQKHRAISEKIVPSLTDLSNTLHTHHKIVSDKIDLHNTSTHAILNPMQEQLNAIHTAKQGWRKWWERFGWYAFALVSILVGAEALIQFGLLTIKWPWSH